MKQRAKQTLQGKYWPILGVSILGGILQGSFFTLLADIYDPQDGILVLFSNFAMDLHALIRIWITMVILSWIYSIFVGHTIWIGLTKYYLESVQRTPSVSSTPFTTWDQLLSQTSQFCGLKSFQSLSRISAHRFQLTQTQSSMKTTTLCAQFTATTMQSPAVFPL